MKGRVLDQVLRREYDHFADMLANAVVVILAHEIAVQPLIRHVQADAVAIQAGAGDIDGIVVEVGGEDLDIQRLGVPLHVLGQQDGQGIGLLAGRAAGNPDAHRIVADLRFQQFRQGLFQGRKGVLIAEKGRDANQQFLEQQRGLVLVVLDVA